MQEDIELLQDKSFYRRDSLESPFVLNNIFNEEPIYSEVSNLDISKILKDLKKRYPKLTTFKKVCNYPLGSEEVRPFVEFMEKNPDKCYDVIMDSDIFYPIPQGHFLYSFTIIDSDFGFVFRREYVRGTILACFLFFNDYDLIKNKFFKKDIRNFPEGLYELAIENNQYKLNNIDLKYTDDPIIEEETKKKILNDIDCFFNNKEFYKNNNLPRKRGIIIHGPAGNGKTSIIKNILSKYSSYHSLLVDCKLFDSSLSEYIDKVFPKDKEKIIIFEDVESITEGDSGNYSKRSSFLNFIDGPKTMDNTLFIATTNHPELVDSALIDRPSRFDKVYKIDLPNETSRRKFLLKYFPDLKNDDNLDKYILDTKDFSGAYFKELFILVGIQKSSIHEAIQDIKKQIKTRRTKKFDANKSLGLQN